MKRNNIYNKGVAKMARQLAASCLLLFFLAGSLMAQNDRQYVIEKGGHYLAHVGTTLQDATTFDPATCLWYSSNNYNYYFMVGTTRKYLKAPLALNGTLSVDDNPGTQSLNNSTLNYFFWDWDHGLARGVLHLEGGDCPYNSGSGQCWEVVWVSFEENTWKMSSGYGYEPTTNSARFLRVTITDHAEALSNEEGGVGNLSDFAMNYEETHALDGTASALSCVYTPAYRQYHIDGLDDDEHNTHIQEVSYYYYGGQYHTDPPTTTTYTNATASGYAWSLSGDGAQYLSWQDNQNQIAEPTLVYSTPNNTTSHKLATLTLAVTYTQDDSQVTQTRTATVTVKIPCQNPTVLTDNTVVTYVGVTISWLPTADEYEVSWKKSTESNWTSVTVGNVTSYTIRGLEFGATYNYKVRATCVTDDPASYSFTTLAEPGLIVNGNIFGGGRMADVGTETGGGNTEIVIVNCDSIGGIYGGNDIAGKVWGTNGAIITLGVNSGNVNGYDTQYGITPANVTLKFGDVYGGGNGYYAYDGSSFEAASANYTSYTVQPGESVKAMTRTHQVGDIVWTNTGNTTKTLDFPSIIKTKIWVSDNYVTADSIFGGAKNAFLTFNGNQDDPDGSLITLDGGTIMAVFGGNNFGGKQGYGQHHIVVNKTTTNLVDSIYNSATTGYGRDFGIRYIFGGGNKVYGSTTNVEIFGGQCDTVFAGGNSADVYMANVTVNCAMGSGSGNIWDKVYSNAINTYDGGIITPKDDYGWNGFGGIYNVRTLFGGNNKATFDSHLNVKVPEITLTSGSLGTVYGGGNSGDMWGYSETGTTINGETVNYGTHVKMDSPTVLVDYLYGGCQMSNVRYSTWVELNDGHVGTVYGGCNVSGDVGSTRVNMNASQFIGEDTPNPEYQKVYGGTYVVASGGIVYKNLFAGGNGYYHCLDANGFYTDALYYTSHNYVGLASPTHNETHVVVKTGAAIKGNVYAGGNLARVGFSNNTAPVYDDQFPRYVGLSSVDMSGGRVYGNVYGGCNMSDVYGSNEVKVSGGMIESLYGGNDRLGRVATPYSNRVLPPEYQVASDGVTSLTDPKVYTYVSLTRNPSITNVYGGGNGDYAYFETFAEAEAYTGDKETVVSCDISDLPIQQRTFVDVGVNGGDANGAHIGTVYGGGDGVTVTGFAKVFLNVKTDPIGYSNVGTIFGGNNKGDLDLVADIVLLNGQVNTVYGGCNEGAMTAYNAPGHMNLKTIGGYEDIGSYVRLLDSYDPDNDPSTNNSVTPNIKVMDAIYGGCRMNGVTNNSLVLVEGSDFSNMTKGLFGGSDISGTVSGKSMVATVGGTVGNVYGGGNGGYYYVEDGTTGEYTVYTDAAHTQLLATGIGGAPSCNYSGVDIWSGQVGVDPSHTGQVFGGGYGQLTVTNRDVIVNIGDAEATSAAATPIIYGDIYGGSALGNVNFPAVGYHTTVNFMNGTLKGNLYGGGLGQQQIGEDPATAIAAKSGGVYVTISSADQNEANCFIDLRQANIFGCNNANGSPQDDVEVHVWKTAHTATDSAFYIGTPPSSLTYAIDQVFGGGDQANYAPENGSTSSTKKATVYVHGCSNTIRRVFSGGNAAAAVGVTDTLEGGRFDYVFGGGNGEDIAANIGAGGTHLVVSGGKITHLFGGSNEQGVITGPIYTEVNGDNTGCEQHITEFFGGSNMAAINTTSGVYSVLKCGAGTFGEVYGGCNKAHIIGDVTLDIKGGTIQTVYGGSKGEAGEGDTGAANITGKVTLNLEGGHITNAFGGSNVHGNITDTITVNVIDYEEEYCGLELTNVYGGSNHANYSPTPASITSPIVNVIHIADSIKGNVYGGGNEAEVTAYPRVNIGYHASSMPLPEDYRYDTLETFPHAFIKGNVFGGGNLAAVNGNNTINVYNGNIRHKLVGGGNAADVNGDVVVNIMGGNVCTEPTGVNAGVYGGCNQSGTINGAITLNITGDNNTQTTIGTQAALINHEPVSVHGGGYGAGTHTKGNVTINYGSGGGEGSDCEYPMLYGELYGGSALGTVNDADASPIDTTTITILNGSVKFELDGETQYGGKIYGGGRGQEGDGNEEKGQVNGEIHVNIGGGIGEDAYGKANLKGCYIFGCNNTNGSPQQHVYVDVYQTKHVDGDYVDDEGDLWDNYAIRNVYGGGNVAHYQPTVNPDNKKKVHNRIHNCGNTIEYVYGGGNAANTIGTEVSVDGGRFKYIFGGGNGQVVPANIGMGGVNISIYGGHVGWYFSACNLHGTVAGGTVEQYGCTDTYCPCYPDTLVVEKYYFGANKALTVGGLSHIINCGDNMNFKYVYGGSRLAVVYGDIKLWVRGGTIENLIAGNEGSMEVQADVKKYPAADYDWYTNPDGHPGEVKTYLDEQHALGNDLYGLGGNLQLVLEGGKLGNVYGGNDFRGNVEGNITVIIDSTQAHPCQLDIDYLYAGNHLSGYTPDSLNHQVHLDPNRISPLVYFKNGHVNYDVFGGSEGGDPSHPFGNGLVVSNPKLVIGNPSNSEHKARVGRDLFGGGSAAKLEGNPIVVLQGKTTVGGNVFGGGKSGDIVGGTDVVIDPDSPIDPPATPIPPKHKLFIQTAGPANAGIVSVKYYENNVEHIVHNGDEVPEGSILQIVATPNTGYLFVEWWTDFGHIEHPTYATTTCLMGSKNTTLKATFRSE